MYTIFEQRYFKDIMKQSLALRQVASTNVKDPAVSAAEKDQFIDLSQTASVDTAPASVAMLVVYVAGTVQFLDLPSKVPQLEQFSSYIYHRPPLLLLLQHLLSPVLLLLQHLLQYLLSLPKSR